MVDLLYDHDGQVPKGMSRLVEVVGYWFLQSLVGNIRPVSIEANVEAILCLTNILLLAHFALNQIDQVVCFASG